MLADKQAITPPFSTLQQKAAMWRQVNSDPFLQKICNIVEERLQDEMSIDDLAKIVYYSRVQVFRKIKSLTGQSPSRFIRAIRLHKALDLLLTTDHKISGIAGCGLFRLEILFQGIQNGVRRGAIGYSFLKKVTLVHQ